MTRFLAVFAVIVLGLLAAELTPPVQAAIVRPWTEMLVVLSGWLIGHFDADVAVMGKVLQSTSNGFAISIEAGCNGIEAGILLIAAIVAFPAPWRHRAIGLTAGLASVQALNVVRVVSLFYLGQWSLRAFDWAHLYAWQALIMLDVLAVWLLWVRYAPKPRAVAA